MRPASARPLVERIAMFFRPRHQEPAEWRAARLTRPAGFFSAQAIISAFYAVFLFFAVANLYSWQSYLDTTALTPRWPIFWLRWVDNRLGIGIILWLHLCGGLAAVTLTRFRTARVFVFLSALWFLAFKFSFGPVNHGSHLGLLLSFVLIFLPAGWHSYPEAPRRVRAATLLVFSGCQALILLLYSMSGLWKVIGILRQIVAGEVHYLYPDGLARQVAAKLLSADETSLLGPWLIEHSWVGPPLALGAIYFEFFALWVLFRPSLHRVWGVSLVLFHLGTHLLMGIGFVENSLWLALFLVLSPFRPPELRWRQVLKDLPLVRW